MKGSIQERIVASVLLLFLTLFEMGAVHNGVLPEDTVMRIEADKFLREMPKGLQRRQASAIRKAMAGDYRDLETVRHSRNNRPAISNNVKATMLSSCLCLFEPRDYDGKPLPLLIYLHGGGWTFGSINSCGRFCNQLAASGKVKVMAVDYRLAPEYPYPCGLEDCCDAMCYAVENSGLLNIDPDRITVGGDSAGGNLAIALVLSGKCDRLPESLLLFYPVTKAFADNSESWDTYGSGFGLDSEIMEIFNEAYVGEEDARNPCISVGLYEEEALGILPRTLLVAAERDILCDQGKEFAGKTHEKVKRVEFPGAVHLFITVPGQERAFNKAVELTLRFIINNHETT